jgi:signal transduction histidine kinase
MYPDDPAFADALEREKLAALKEFAYGASHEINNPLANIATRAQALLMEEQHPEKRRKLATIVAQAMRAHEMISDLMLFAKPPEPELKRIEVLPLLEQVVASLQPQIREQNTSVEVSVEPTDLWLTADEVQLTVAVQSLVRNALEALQEGGCISVSAHREENHVVVSVQDDGPGISPETRRHIFDPFYSGREAGRGLGFGLCKCWRIAEMHGGRIVVESEPGSGATFTLLFPLPAT